MNKVEELNKMQVVEFSLDGKEIESIYVENTEMNRDILFSIGADSEDIAAMQLGNGKLLDIAIIAFEKTNAAGWSKKDGFIECEDKLNISKFVYAVGQNAVEHGWWQGEERSFGELIALCHSELSEALEEYRNGHKPGETYYTNNRKPEGIPTELADVIIRIFDMCNHYDIDIEKAIIEKHSFNKSRPFRHGNKVI